MKKIPTLFKRDFTQPGNPIIPEYSEGTDWVVAGEGVATRKYDGTSVLIRNHKMYKRYELRPGKTAPTDFEQVDYDETTGKAVGWVQVGWGAEDKYFREAAGGDPDKVDLSDGTFELLGPKVQGDPEKMLRHVIFRHERAETYNPEPPTDFYKLRDWLEPLDIEGLVWHHPDGRMVKIKKKDFGLKRNPTLLTPNPERTESV
jgi:hypothetical protein